MANTRASALAPATVANLGIGFDILGLAVDGLGDTITAQWHDAAPTAQMLSIEGDAGKLPLAAHLNVATIAANALLSHLDCSQGVGLHLKKGLPLASGLGSSAASAVAAVVAVNALLDYPLPQRDLLPFALEGEAAVSGYHADNVAPSLLGGITLSNGVTIEQLKSLPIPSNLHLALVTPHIEVPTATARAVLPQDIPLKTMIHHTGAVASFIAALYEGDLLTMAQMMESDQVIEPARQHLMPHLNTIRKRAKAVGALAVVIGGAGPTLLALCDAPSIAQQVARTMQATYHEAQINCLSQATTVRTQGATVLFTE